MRYRPLVNTICERRSTGLEGYFPFPYNHQHPEEQQRRLLIDSFLCIALFSWSHPTQVKHHRGCMLMNIQNYMAEKGFGFINWKGEQP